MRLVVLCLCILAAGCHSPLTYAPSEIALFRAKNSGVELTYQTRAGRQTAFYVPPQKYCDRPPERLVIVFPGIRSRALEWLEMINRASDPDAAFLLIDYPGRGRCEGRMRPRHLVDSSFGALDALADHLNTKQVELTTDLRLLGHSFGCGAALQFACSFKVTRIILIAPFTTLHKAAYRQYGPLAWLIPDRMDNGKWLRELSDRSPCPAVVIIHGSADDVIPVKMGRELADGFPDWIIYHEIAGGDHVGILKTCEALIFQMLFPGRSQVCLPFCLTG
jgi:pimeloyl-ACP methyl ester carboxylesterase